MHLGMQHAPGSHLHIHIILTFLQAELLKHLFKYVFVRFETKMFFCSFIQNKNSRV